MFNGGRLRREERVAMIWCHFPKLGGESDIALQNWAVRKDTGCPAFWGRNICHELTSSTWAPTWQVTVLCSGLSCGSLGNSPGGSHSGLCRPLLGSQSWGCRGVTCWMEGPTPTCTLLGTNGRQQGGTCTFPPKGLFAFYKNVFLLVTTILLRSLPQNCGQSGRRGKQFDSNSGNVI